MSTSPAAGRPHMAASYGVDPKATAGVLAWDLVDDGMRTSHNYWVTTTGPAGRPHATPVWGVWLDGALHFGTDTASRKARNLAANPAMVAHLESVDDVVIIDGEAVRVSDAGSLARFVDAFEDKYDIRLEAGASGAGEAMAVFRLDARAVFAWRERDFPATATRWTIDSNQNRISEDRLGQGQAGQRAT